MIDISKIKKKNLNWKRWVHTLTAEGLTIRTSISQARELGFEKLCVASDSQQIIRAINANGGLWNHVGYFLSFFSISLAISLGYVPR